MEPEGLSINAGLSLSLLRGVGRHPDEAYEIRNRDDIRTFRNGVEPGKVAFSPIGYDVPASPATIGHGQTKKCPQAGMLYRMKSVFVA
jgi:hypothetical protein